jgi:hypothetical protein
MTKEDQDAINSFVYEQILKDRIRIKEGVKAYLDDRSESKAFIERVEEIIDDVTVNS